MEQGKSSLSLIPAVGKYLSKTATRHVTLPDLAILKGGGVRQAWLI